MPELRAKPSTKILQPTLLNRNEGRVGGEGDFMWLGRFLLSHQDAAHHTPWNLLRKDKIQLRYLYERNAAAADHV